MDIIKSYRNEKGISQFDMADKIGLTQSSYAKLENGATALDVDRLVNIAKVLKLPIIKLFPQELIEVNKDSYTLEEYKNISEAIIGFIYDLKDNNTKELENKLMAQNLTIRELIKKISP